MSKPAPFKRPSINMNRSGRTWQRVKAIHLRQGDVVQDKGLISTITQPEDYDGPETIVHYVNGNIEWLEPDDRVFAFVRKVVIEDEDAGA